MAARRTGPGARARVRPPTRRDRAFLGTTRSAARRVRSIMAAHPSSAAYGRAAPRPPPRARRGAARGRRMRVGLVSDTHGLYDPKLDRLFAGCALILHAGDVVKP